MTAAELVDVARDGPLEVECARRGAAAAATATATATATAEDDRRRRDRTGDDRDRHVDTRGGVGLASLLPSSTVDRDL